MINFNDDFQDWAFQVYGCFDPIMRKSLRPRNKGPETNSILQNFNRA